MARKPKGQPGEDAQAMDMIVARTKKEEEAIREIEEQYGDGQPYERLRLENEIRFYQQQMGESLIETGKRLIRIKANEAHGGFLQVLENLDMAARSAQYAMTAARKFGNTPTLAHLDGSKIKALTVLDDDSIQALEDGKEVAGVAADEIEKMSVRELRAVLREEQGKRKKEKQAQEDAIAKKEEKINELERELRLRPQPTKEQLAEAQLQELNKGFFSALMCLAEDIHQAQSFLNKAERVEHVTYPLLREWVNRHVESFEIIKEDFIELQEAIKQPCINSGEAEDEQAEP